MKKCNDTYKEVRTITFPNGVARVHIPDLTAEERKRRMAAIAKAAESLLKSCEVNKKDVCKRLRS